MESSDSGVSECVREPRKEKHGEGGVVSTTTLAMSLRGGIQVQYLGYESKVTSNNDQSTE